MAPYRRSPTPARLLGAGLGLMRRRAARSVADSSRRCVALVHSSSPRMSQAAGVGVMACSKAGTAKCAAGERRPPRYVPLKRLVSPKPFADPSARRRGVHPGGPDRRAFPHECRPEGPRRALLRAGPLIVRRAASRGEPGTRSHRLS